jgi:hypothetical protein
LPAELITVGKRFFALLLALAACFGVTIGAPDRVGARTGPVVISYEVAGRGNVSSLEDFAAEAAAAYADPRGWNLGGSILFDRVRRGGDFTLWLASDTQLPSFGGGCEHDWSCRNGRHLVINESRWLAASPAWRAAGGALSTYRQMVLNHETGHWLGFDHAACPGGGAPAPVMHQQSMTLAGCFPNPWPLPAERAALAARRGVTVVPAGPAPCDRPPFALRPWKRCL